MNQPNESTTETRTTTTTVKEALWNVYYCVSNEFILA